MRLAVSGVIGLPSEGSECATSYIQVRRSVLKSLGHMPFISNFFVYSHCLPIAEENTLRRRLRGAVGGGSRGRETDAN